MNKRYLNFYPEQRTTGKRQISGKTVNNDKLISEQLAIAINVRNRRKIIPENCLATWLSIFFVAFFFLYTNDVEAFGFNREWLVSSEITQNPIEVVFWIKEGVTVENEQRVIAQIREGLALWENVPTAHLAFEVKEIIRSATDPGKEEHQLQIIVGNSGTLIVGGASYPLNGNPGTWFGAVADKLVNHVIVSAHEIGHALGFFHSSVYGDRGFDNFPVALASIMHWRVGNDGLSADDIAAVSTAYPNSSQPLAAVSGTVRGILVDQFGNTIDGVNAVAKNMTNSELNVSRFSGRTGYLLPGEFVIPGLTPGDYELVFDGGSSFQGSHVENVYQADNFAKVTTSVSGITAGEDRNLGTIKIYIEPVSITKMHVGGIGSHAPFEYQSVVQQLPPVTLNEEYEVFLLVEGGLRALTLKDVRGVPSGLRVSLLDDPRSFNVDTTGAQYVHIIGTPVAATRERLTFTLRDQRGFEETFSYAWIFVGQDQTPFEPLVLLGVRSSVEGTTVRIAWQTNVPTNASVYYYYFDEENNKHGAWKEDFFNTYAHQQHVVTLRNLLPNKTYFYEVSSKRQSDAAMTMSSTYSFQVDGQTTSPIPLVGNQDSNGTVEDHSTNKHSIEQEEELQKRIAGLGYVADKSERDFVEKERSLVTTIDRALTRRLTGRVLLQVEGRGEAWYVDASSEKRFYLRHGAAAFAAMRAFGLGITDADLRNIPIGIDNRFGGADADRDQLPDALEKAIGTSILKADSDGDGYVDGDEVRHHFNPLGEGLQPLDQSLVDRLKGTILLQVESRGEAWYVNPADGKRYYMKDGNAAFQIMRFLSLGISNEDLHKIDVGKF